MVIFHSFLYVYPEGSPCTATTNPQKMAGAAVLLDTSMADLMNLNQNSWVPALEYLGI
jgi:hypothetical protein